MKRELKGYGGIGCNLLGDICIARPIPMKRELKVTGGDPTLMGLQVSQGPSR